MCGNSDSRAHNLALIINSNKPAHHIIRHIFYMYTHTHRAQFTERARVSERARARKHTHACGRLLAFCYNVILVSLFPSFHRFIRWFVVGAAAVNASIAVCFARPLLACLPCAIYIYNIIDWLAGEYMCALVRLFLMGRRANKTEWTESSSDREIYTVRIILCPRSINICIHIDEKCARSRVRTLI